MILDYCKNYKTYAKLLPKLEQGLAFVETLKDSAPGRYESGTDGIFALVEQGLTWDICTREFETHKRYIDVQILVEGEEKICWAEAGDLNPSQAYNEERDIAFHTGEGLYITVKAGMFYIEFPTDAHKCCGMIGEVGSAYRKFVLKLPIENA